MAKTYLTTAKYMIKIKFDIDGVVEKEDIIGAVFGQSEGLLGDEMDLKELQQSGKLGRIEVTNKSEFGKTYGELMIPSSMNMPETALLAAAVESVEKVGPCDSKFDVLGITDVRLEKRASIKERAKLLLEKFKKDEMPNAVELADEIKESARELSVASYGNDKLACGPGIEKEEEIIVVEGRADVMNMLRNNIKNVIEMGGANISADVIELSKKKETTLFIDGDRGGELNSRKFMQLANVDYIAVAPDGKEVEELARKEILLSLKRKEMISEGKVERKPFAEERRHYSADERPHEQRRERFSPEGRRPPRQDSRGERSFGRERRPFAERTPRGPSRSFSRGADEGGRFHERAPYPQNNFQPQQAFAPVQASNPEESAKFRPLMDVLKGSMKARLFNPAMEEILSTDVRNILDALEKSHDVHAVVFDGIITKRLVDVAREKSVKYLVGIRKANIGDSKDVRALVF